MLLLDRLHLLRLKHGIYHKWSSTGVFLDCHHLSVAPTILGGVSDQVLAEFVLVLTASHVFQDLRLVLYEVKEGAPLSCQLSGTPGGGLLVALTDCGHHDALPMLLPRELCLSLEVRSVFKIVH